MLVSADTASCSDFSMSDGNNEADKSKPAAQPTGRLEQGSIQQGKIEQGSIEQGRYAMMGSEVCRLDQRRAAVHRSQMSPLNAHFSSL